MSLRLRYAKHVIATEVHAKVLLQTKPERERDGVRLLLDVAARTMSVPAMSTTNRVRMSERRSNLTVRDDELLTRR